MHDSGKPMLIIERLMGWGRTYGNGKISSNIYYGHKQHYWVTAL